jgi:hypothetical protein
MLPIDTRFWHKTGTFLERFWPHQKATYEEAR